MSELLTRAGRARSRGKQFVKPPQPIGEEEKSSFILGAALGEVIQLEGIAVPLHHTAFVWG
jgi:hypothetical protein